MIMAPIALFTYNRPQHVRMLIESLLENDLSSQSELFIFSDGPKNKDDALRVDKVRAYIHQIRGFQSVHIEESPINQGLANSVIYGVSKVLQEYDRIIVLEDDLVLSPFFLQFMNDALEVYKDVQSVGNVNGHKLGIKYACDTYFIHHMDSWGWGTWRRAWNKFEPDGNKLMQQLKERGLCKQFDFEGAYPFVRMLQRQIEGKNSSWAIRWRASLLLNNLLCLNAGESFVINNGADGSGTHLKKGILFPDAPLAIKPITVLKKEPVESALAKKAYIRYYRWNNSKLHKAIVRLQTIF